MSKVVITTVGTSLIEREGNNIKVTKPCAIYSKWGDSNKEISILRTNLTKLLALKPNDNDICAEVKSCLKIQETYTDLEVYLICTDTILSPLCAEYIKIILESKGMTVHFDYSKGIDLKSDYNKGFIIEGLVVDGKDAAKKFEESGFSNLIKRIKSLEEQRVKPINDTLKQELDNIKGILDVDIRKGKALEANEKAQEDEKQTRILVNISGGYKALVPVVTVMGQLYNMEVNYIYEDSEELIKIGSMPINFDWLLGEFYLEYLTKEGLSVIKNSPIPLNELRLMGLIKKDKYKLTIIGELFRDYICNLDTTKKSTIGYLVELKVYEYFNKNKITSHPIVERGRPYWWSKIDKTKYSHTAQFNQDDSKEQKIDVDIFLSDGYDHEIWSEVKSYSESKVKDAKRQIETFLSFISNTSYSKVKKVQLILYKLPKVADNKYESLLIPIKTLFKNSSIEFSIQIIELPKNNKDLVNIKSLFENDFILKEYYNSKSQ